MYYCTVSKGRTWKGTSIIEVFWWRGAWDVTIQGVKFKGLSRDEYFYLLGEF